MTSNTTSHVAVWAQLEGLKGDELTAWRMNAVENRATVKERNLDTLPLPFGWFMVAYSCLLYTSPSPRDATLSRMPSSA